MPRATIQAKNAAVGSLYSAQSKTDGTYSLELLPGTYEISISGPSPVIFPFERKGVAVQPGQTVRIDARLEDVGLGTPGDGGATLLSLVMPPPAPTGPPPRAAGGKPDLSGVWLPALPSVVLAPDLMEWAQKLQMERLSNGAKDFPETHCLPNG